MKTRSKLPPSAIVTLPPLAVAVRSLSTEMAAEIVPVIPMALATLTEPYVMLPGRLSNTIFWVSENTAAASLLAT